VPRAESRCPWRLSWVLVGCAAGLWGVLNGFSQAADLEACRKLRQQRDLMASQAMEQEIALVRAYRIRLCPQLATLAEGANARDQEYGSLDYAAWNRCRREAEQQLEATTHQLYRNRQRFTFYTADGAALARQADQLSEDLHAQGCLLP
jgi:hypothetical protein